MGSCISRVYNVAFGWTHLTTEVEPTRPAQSIGNSELVNLGTNENLDNEDILRITIDEEMSAPTVQLSNENQTALGHGLAVVDCAVNSSTQSDASYWEWHVEESMSGGAVEVESGGEDGKCLMFGVSTKRNQNFYEILANSAGTTNMMLKQCTKLMKELPNISHDDTVGVAIQLKSNDPTGGKLSKPTMQLYINGELKETFDLGRFRGEIYPAVWLPSSFGEGGGKDVVVTFVHDEREFKQLSPHARFHPLEGKKVADIV
uniref:SPRY domain-containing protein n=1 Tax=Helicotheca tamesis TaxID=374047 RepID=A0A7S2HKG8_9STRA|mmetsp:Transcript_18880/g.25972  ORF Transcript_18880/g.25972 Transcript_18880/m.25972 type:complete len:260 (+) Transcript_18880:138-917(+)|eukprot:CAMPEP_0185729658 /NCGR_PEP_ID=MMETSP1171-20130828/6861_1 /TAXON_ID=374046 /ORGANISM="Helicotheca tamensis, Strain CCMP826" /LENGTH=259 /DNA_ID=CAMNT_0028398549 /DNA_START=63 /DNA_END=842 /DNA_ORIENTATION=-